MRSLHRFIIPLLLLILVDWMLSLVACKKKETTKPDACKPVYATDIKPVITAKCALSGCHDANSTVNRFTIDSVVKSKADQGRIRSHVFELNIMPPQSSPQLTADEKDKLKCWLDNGASLN